MALLEIRDLHVSVDGRPILNGIDLSIEAGQTHAIMGPNGSGKSTLAQVIAGREGYVVTQGSIAFDGQDLLAWPPEVRAREGVLLAFQYPVAIPGVSNMYFLKAAVNAIRQHRGQPQLDVLEFMELVRSRMSLVGMTEALLKRPVNDGFSGGEKKRNEIFQMVLLEPRLGILDETDSGLDIDALQVVANGVNALRNDQRSFLVITHYQRILNYIVPEAVHVLLGGRIVRSGGKELALELEASGYAGFQDSGTSLAKGTQASPS